MLAEIVKLGSGVALHEKSLDDIMMIVKAIGFEPDFLERIGNHELRARLYDFYGLVPQEPVAFLRYILSFQAYLSGTEVGVQKQNVFQSPAQEGSQAPSAIASGLSQFGDRTDQDGRS